MHATQDAIGLLAHLQPRRVLLLGDLLLDMYTYGSVSRISPEAPVPILQVHHQIQLPGGAGNVALNLSGLGNKVILIGRIGADLPAAQLQQLLHEKGAVDLSRLVVQKDFPTPVKNRLMASSQQLLRVDHEQPMALDTLARSQMLEHALACLPQVDIIAISDYGKGGIDRQLLAPLFEQAARRAIPILVDPKSRDLRLYQGATLIKPNLKEACEACSQPISLAGAKSPDLDRVAADLFAQMGELPYLLITRSHEGLSLFDRKGARRDFPARAMEVVDVTGAGDCVLAALVHGMACGLPMEGCCHLANMAGALAVQKLGCVQLSLKELARQMLKVDSHNKIFDKSHLFALQEACRGERVHLLQAERSSLNNLDFLLSLRRYRRLQPQVLLILELEAQRVSEEWIELLIGQDYIDLLLLKETQGGCYPIEVECTLRWQEGELACQPAEASLCRSLS